MKNPENYAMNRNSKIFAAVILNLLLGLFVFFAAQASSDGFTSEPQLITPAGPGLPQDASASDSSAVEALYFYANDCAHCMAILDELIQPMQADLGEMLDIRLLEISYPLYYEAMLLVEAHFGVDPSERGIPTLVIADQVLIGESQVRESFPGLVQEGVDQGGLPLPLIEGLDLQALVSINPDSNIAEEELCDTDESCAVEAPIYVAYFYQTGCKECNRVEADLTYLQTQFPQMQIVEFNVYDQADLAVWMTEQIDFTGEFHTPALFIGEHVLVAEEILPENITSVLMQYQITGAEPYWLSYSPEQGRQSIVERFQSMGWLAVVAAGLIDGINPCAFATLIFFVSYLTLSGRKGREILLVGGAFTLGVFVAYLAVGLGLYQVLELVGSALEVIAKFVYVITGVFCLVLAVISFMDYRKAKRGQVGEMMLNLPKQLRKRINATIRKGSKSSRYVIGAFGAGILVSFLELACTGQVYLPTIIFVSSIPELRLQAVFYLILYNLLFVLPLVIIFFLVYYGTTSKQLTEFLQEKAAAVKFGMGIVFIALGGWLLFSVII